METSPDARNTAPTAPEAEVGTLERKTRGARAELSKVLADLAQAQAQLDGHHVQLLLQANEQLVIDAVRSRTMAESAAQLVTELTRSSELDVLTGLPNRVLLFDRFTQALTHAKRRDSRLALLFLDLDQFKQINDTQGHPVGDAVLRAVGHTLNACVREVDTVCRMGGDEFVLLLAEVANVADAGLVAEKLVASLAQLTTVEGVAVHVSASIGIAVYPDDGADVERLTDCADQAMYRSKRAGGNCYRFFTAHDSHADPALPGKPRDAGDSQLLEANQNLVLSAMAASAVAEQKELLLKDLQHAATNKDEFLSVLGHELRNPLAPLVTTLDVMRLRAGGHETVEHSTMRRHLGHLMRLVGDLQDVAKIATGKVDLRLAVVQISDVATEAIAMARPLLEQRQQRFSFNEAPQPMTCRGDPVRLEQCIANLLINAAKYTPPGGTISLTTRQDGAHAVITVKDNGRGISAEALPDVFNLFFQERGEAQLRDAGLGVGLALVRSLVGLHAGSVGARSDGVGLGSEFTIRLPLLAAEDAEPLQAGASALDEAALTPRRRILIVDDNYDAADSLALLLRLYGHDVWVATHPVAALQMVATATPDLALLDIGLPGMDGYELARRIRQQYPELRVAMVALSGYGRAVDFENSTAAGFDAHLVKPVQIDELEHVVRTVHFTPPA
ncbi:diguanylate cyclase domain-containing protein [Roseateles sp.]|uniref:diguanylate cyclase domain-containing protein n=1 Tax=Roseateles sp. TaxID=1971397 RepID=UPI003265463C